ncbi:MAG: tetratricopeptide (TPR) repeat protein [Planctomycetota bacterium]|jgi:tetratricopeptide (TPR) repeat protein
MNRSTSWVSRLGPASLGILVVACAARPISLQPSIEGGASAALAEALDLWRDQDAAELKRALAAAREASLLAPDWVAPLRFLDDRMREELLGPNALEQHRDALSEEPEDAVRQYLAGRLEGTGGEERFRRAVTLEPRLAWAQHGLAWTAFQEGRIRDAIRAGERALERSRDPFERANFSATLARYLRASNEHPIAIRMLEHCLAERALSPRSRVWIQSELARTELGADQRLMRRRGARRALDLIASAALSRGELAGLVAALRFPRRSLSVKAADVDLALAQRETDATLVQASTILPGSVLELELWDRDTAGVGISARALRLVRMRHGDARDAIEQWLAELPAQVLDPRGLPRDPRLLRVVNAAHALGDVGIERADRGVAAELGDALIGAGWFLEASALAARVPGGDLDLALDLSKRAQAGRATVSAVGALLRDLPSKRPRFPAVIDELPTAGPAGSPKEPRIDSLETLLDALSGIFQRAHLFLGGELDRDVVRAQLAGSPRVDYGWVGSVLHPGRVFSPQDERLGRGQAGQVVPGLAQEMHRLGRFAVVGDVAGSVAPDGTVLGVVLIERRSGEHLGIPWSGTVAWCQTGDFSGGASRSGVAIGGAALHEGYFVDLDVVRGEYERWRRLARYFSEPDGAQRVSRALAVRGVKVARGETWTSTDLPLGESDRMRLAVMVDRAEPGSVLGEVPFEDFVRLTATHEEGHLCDRTRLYPVSEHLMSVLNLLFSVGFMPAGAHRLLEYRAQLVALCELPDPRLAWAEILQAAESGDDVTPHAAAYTRLLRNLLEEAQRAWRRDPLAWPELDPDRMLVHQVHHLRPEKLRALALAVARRHGYEIPDRP